MMIFRILSVFAMGVLFIETASATTFLMMSEEEKMKAASSICAIEVESLVSERYAGAIRTRASVRLIKQNDETISCFKGSEPERFDIVWPGGRLTIMDKDGKPKSEISRVIGTPNLKKGESYVLYLWRRNPADVPTVLSWMEGVNPLQFDQASREFKLVSRRSSGESLGRTAQGGRETKSVRSRASTPDSKMNLSDFRQKVQRTLRQP